MNLFRDDFYSTKVSNRSIKGRHSRNPMTLLIIVLSALCGVLLTLLLIQSQSNQAHSPTVMESLSDQIVQAAEQVNPTVVSIISSQSDEEHDIQFEIGYGSGVIFEISQGKARVVTNNHVIEYANQLDIVLHDGTRKPAEILGMDLFSDLAVLEIDAQGIEYVAQFGDSDQLKSGQTAIAIGNPLGLGYSHSTTVGVISSPLRTIPVTYGLNDWELDVIQTDAAINMGNSGGALVDLNGEVIGINSMKVANMGVEGLGFAIPINAAIPIIESLMEHGRVLRPIMGVHTEDLYRYPQSDTLQLPEEVTEGVVILNASGPAEEAELARYDVIVQIDEAPIYNTMMLRKYLYEHRQIGDTIKVHYYREGHKESTLLVLVESTE